MSNNTKKRNKKRNLNKMKVVSAKLKLKNLAVLHNRRDETTIVINYHTLSYKPITRVISDSVTEFRHKWQMLLLIIGEDDNCKAYFKVDPVPVINEMYQRDLAKYLSNRHEQFIEKSFNKRHLRNVAWLAIPDSKQADKITDRQIENILNAYKVW